MNHGTCFLHGLNGADFVASAEIHGAATGECEVRFETEFLGVQHGELDAIVGRNAHHDELRLLCLFERLAE